MDTTTGNKLDQAFKWMVVFAIGLACLILTKDIVLPIAFAALFSVVLLPISKRIEQKTGRILAITLTLFGAFLLLALIMWFVIAQLASLVQGLPDIQERFYALINETSSTVSKNFNISTSEQAQLLKDAIKNVSSHLGEWLLSTSYLAYFFVQVPIYIFLFILYRDRFKDFLLALRPGSDLKWKDEIQGVVRSYISGLTLVVLIAGVLNSIGLLFLGIEYAIFFGFLSGALTMIPYVGITIGATLPALMALVTKDSIWYAVGVVGVHAFVQFLEGNFITPKITGSKISINALAAIVALLLGGKIWGIPGMILAVPAIGVFKILLSYSPDFKSLVILLGDEPSKNSQDEASTENKTPDSQLG